MLEGAKRIIELYEDDEFKPYIIEGDHGIGKTSYANRLIAEVYSKPELGWGGNGKQCNWRIDLFKSHMGFHPRLVIKKWKNKKSKDYSFHWDDAGLWLHSLDYQNKFVKATGKYMQVIRNKWACVMFTAISREDITNKVRGLRNAIIIEITKHDKSYKDPDKRTAIAYILRKGPKGREWKDHQWEEPFDSIVPGEYVVDRKGRVLKQSGFYGWYKPQRDKYTTIAEKLIEKSMDEDKDFDIKDKELV